MAALLVVLAVLALVKAHDGDNEAAENIEKTEA